MPKILDRLVSQLMDKGHSKSAVYAIATKSLQRSGNLKREHKKLLEKVKYKERKHLLKELKKEQQRSQKESHQIINIIKRKIL